MDNTATDKLETHRAEMVVLAVGMHPPEQMKVIQEMLALQKSPDGFYLEAHPKLQPVDSATRGVFFAGCAEGPKDIKESVTQASRRRRPGHASDDPGQAQGGGHHRRGGRRAPAPSAASAARSAPTRPSASRPRAISRRIVNAAACMGCGTCAAECPARAITMHHFTDGQINAQIDATLEEETQERILIFACNWCSYAGADFAGVARLQYPANTRLIRTMCSGRVSEDFIWRAFRLGAPVVLLSGCHFGDCHYINANHWTERRVKRLWRKMEKLGLRPERLRLEWISAAEGLRFRQVMEGMEELRASVSPEEVAQTKVILAQAHLPEEKQEAQAQAAG